MRARKTTAAVLFSASLVLWVVMIYSVYVLPHQAEVWADTAEAPPAAMAFLVSVGELRQRFGLILYPSLFLMTIASAVWFVAVSRAQRKG